MSRIPRTKIRRKASDYEAISDQLLADMRHLNELMQKDRTEIDYFKAETARLETYHRDVLFRLKAMW